jgi:hypothetical protein
MEGQVEEDLLLQGCFLCLRDETLSIICAGEVCTCIVNHLLEEGNELAWVVPLHKQTAIEGCKLFVSHRDYGKRMLLSFNEEIQNGYYQNTLVSMEGALLEWINAAGAMHTRYFGHWSENLKQDTLATTQNMHCELWKDRDTMQLVNGITFGGMVWKGTDGTITLYCCGKSIYNQGKLLAKLHIDVQVEVLRHGKRWLDGKMGFNKRYCQQCMCCIMTPETAIGRMQMLSAKWIERDSNTFAMSPANKCVHLLSNPMHLNSIKSKGMQAKRKGRALVSHND